MAADPALKSMMTTTVDIAAPASTGASGAIATWDSPSTVVAYIEPRTRVVKTADGERLVPGHFVITEDAITREHRVWLPEEDSSSDAGHRPVSIEAVRSHLDGDVISHYEVTL